MDKYKKYKNTETKLLSTIPSHWTIKKFKNITEKNGVKAGPFGSDLKDSDYIEISDYSVFRQRNVIDDNYDIKKRYISKTKYENLKQFQVSNGDLLITTRGTIGKVSIFEEIKKGVIHPCLIRIKLLPKINKKYIKFLMENSIYIFDNIKLLSNATTIDVIYSNTIKNLTVYLPPYKEQIAIANFLDEKTGTIDSAVEELENQRKLLKELKQATIHKAVTKGLDDNATMKDSGVEWIGEIPVDWEVRRLKDFFSFQMGNTIIKEDLNNEGKGLPVYSATREDKYFGFFENFNLKLKKDDIVFGARGTIGFPKICREDCTSSQTTIACIKKRPKVNSKFVHYFLMGNHEVIFSFTKTAMPQFTVNNAKEIYIVINDDEEKIVDFLDKKISKIDSSLEEIESKIKHLKEYKKTLINDAVTGKIKVYKGED